MLHWARLVHENLAVIATFAYSQAALDTESNKHFHGGRAAFKFLHKITYEIPSERSIKALMELALYFRALDDEQKLTDLWKQVGVPAVGMLVFKDGTTKPLPPREMSNKIIHAEKIEWDLSGPPKIICTARDKELWLRAEINLIDMLGIGARLGS